MLAACRWFQASGIEAPLTDQEFCVGLTTFFFRCTGIFNRFLAYMATKYCKAECSVARRIIAEQRSSFCSLNAKSRCY